MTQKWFSDKQNTCAWLSILTVIRCWLTLEEPDLHLASPRSLRCVVYNPPCQFVQPLYTEYTLAGNRKRFVHSNRSRHGLLDTLHLFLEVRITYTFWSSSWILSQHQPRIITRMSKIKVRVNVFIFCKTSHSTGRTTTLSSRIMDSVVTSSYTTVFLCYTSDKGLLRKIFSALNVVGVW